MVSRDLCISRQHEVEWSVFNCSQIRPWQGQICVAVSDDKMTMSLSEKCENAIFLLDLTWLHCESRDMVG